MTQHKSEAIEIGAMPEPQVGKLPNRGIDLFDKIPLLKKICQWRGFQFTVVFPNLVIFYFFLICGIFGSPVGNRNIIVIFVPEESAPLIKRGFSILLLRMSGHPV